MNNQYKMSNPRKGSAPKPLDPVLKEQLINAYVNEFLTIEQTALRIKPIPVEGLQYS